MLFRIILVYFEDMFVLWISTKRKNIFSYLVRHRPVANIGYRNQLASSWIWICTQESRGNSMRIHMDLDPDLNTGYNSNFANGTVPGKVGKKIQDRGHKQASLRHLVAPCTALYTYF
jgi:hypothetical protein